MKILNTETTISIYILKWAISLTLIFQIMGCSESITVEEWKNLEARLREQGIYVSKDHNTTIVEKNGASWGFILRSNQNFSADQIITIKRTVEDFLREAEGRGKRYGANFFEIRQPYQPGSKEQGRRVALDLSAIPTTSTVLSQSESSVFLLNNHFQESGISFDYPKDWQYWESDSFERIKSALKSQGADLLVMLKSNDNLLTFQVSKSKNLSSFDSFYQGKEEAAKQVTIGMEIMGQRYVKYSVTLVNLSNNQKAVLGYAEKGNGATGISYQLLSGGYEYDINFIYEHSSVAEKGEKLRQRIIETVRINK